MREHLHRCVHRHAARTAAAHAQRSAAQRSAVKVVQSVLCPLRASAEAYDEMAEPADADGAETETDTETEMRQRPVDRSCAAADVPPHSPTVVDVADKTDAAVTAECAATADDGGAGTSGVVAVADECESSELAVPRAAAQAEPRGVHWQALEMAMRRQPHCRPWECSGFQWY